MTGSGGDGSAPAEREAAAASDDVRQLQSMGYAQELHRRMGGFSNFAISFSIICILAGGITSLQLGLGAVGGAAAGIIWPLGVLFSLIVAACMAMVASAFPTAGALYHWSAILGGRGWGWATAWLNLLGLIFVTAAVNVGAYGLFVQFVGPMLGIDPERLGVQHQWLGVALITLSQAVFNHFGIRLTTRLTDFSGYLIFALTLLLSVVMLVGAPELQIARLFELRNLTGPAGGDVWPETSSGWRAILLASMWPIYTITGFDASAHTSEETVGAASNVPRGILRSVAVSGAFGWLLVSSFVLAAPDLSEAVRRGPAVFPWLMARVAPGALGQLLWVGIVAANYLCGLACVTSTSRMTYAFARDGGLPLSRLLTRVSPRWRTPVPAIWVTAVLAVASTLYAPAYSTLTTACVSFLYLSYVMPTLVGAFAFGRTWTRVGPFNLGRRVYRALAAASVLGAGLVVWIGVQPPNEKALSVLGAACLILLGAWWLGVRRRFEGPPVTSLTLHPEPAAAPPGVVRDS